MSTLLTIVHVIVCLFLVLTILLQSGKGGGMGGAFGGGNTATVFGGGGASTFLRKLTAGAATIFMVTSMVLAFLASHNAADPLDKFGNDEAERAKKKDEAAQRAIDEAKKNAPKPGVGSGAAAGSASGSAAGSGVAAGSGGGAAAGGATGSGSSTTPATGTAPAAGSAHATVPERMTPGPTPPAGSGAN